MIDPDASPIVAPAVALAASRVAALLQELDPASGVGLAVVPVHIIRRARDNLILPALVTISVTVPIPVAVITVAPAALAATFDGEISPTTMIDPDAPARQNPSYSLPGKEIRCAA